MAEFNPSPKPFNSKKFVVFETVKNSVWSRNGKVFTCEVSALQESPKEAFEFGGSLTLNLPLAGLVKFHLFVPQLMGHDEDAEVGSWKYTDKANDLIYIIYND